MPTSQPVSRFSTLPTGPLRSAATVSTNAIVMEVSDRVHAFSAMTGTVDTALVAPSLTSLSRSVASLTAQDNADMAPTPAMLAASAATAPGATAAA